MQENNLTTMAKGPEQTSATAEEEVLQNLPPDIKKVIEFGFMMQRTSGPQIPPFADKINEEHITKILEISEKETNLVYKDSHINKIIISILFVVFLGSFIYLCIFLINNNKDELLED